MKPLLFVILAAGICVSAYAGDVGEPGRRQIYLGTGIGLDYGGIGGKIEFLPARHFGLLAGVGYNFLSVGWNVGGTCKILPGKAVSPNLAVLYGYNATSIGTDSYSERYNMTSYGLSIGVSLDIRVNRRGHKISVGLFYPFVSDKFTDNYNKLLNDPNMGLYNKLWPVRISIGFDFLL